MGRVRKALGEKVPTDLIILKKAREAVATRPFHWARSYMRGMISVAPKSTVSQKLRAMVEELEEEHAEADFVRHRGTRRARKTLEKKRTRRRSP